MFFNHRNTNAVYFQNLYTLHVYFYSIRDENWCTNREIFSEIVFSPKTLFSGTYTTLKTFVLITTDRTDRTWNFKCVLMVNKNQKWILWKSIIYLVLDNMQFNKHLVWYSPIGNENCHNYSEEIYLYFSGLFTSLGSAYPPKSSNVSLVYDTCTSLVSGRNGLCI